MLIGTVNRVGRLAIYTRIDTEWQVMRLKCKRFELSGIRCRKCPACHHQRIRQWVLRMLLEAALYPADQVTMVLLTYRDDQLPRDDKEAKHQFQCYMKRVRKDLKVGGLRYVAGLEKAPLTRRYHWHVIFYGLRFTQINRHFLQQKWIHGFTFWKLPKEKDRGKSMAYVMKYAVKDGVFLASRKPPIGEGMVSAINEMIDTLSPQELSNLADARECKYILGKKKLFKNVKGEEVLVNWEPYIKHGKTISCLKIGGYRFPLHQFLKNRLRDLRLKNEKEK